MSDDKNIDRNMVTIGVTQLPVELRKLAWWWRQEESRRVAARKDDAGEYRLMQMRPGEPVWVGWYLVNFNE